MTGFLVNRIKITSLRRSSLNFQKWESIFESRFMLDLGDESEVVNAPKRRPMELAQ